MLEIETDFLKKSISKQISLLYKMAEVETVEEQVTSQQVGPWRHEKKNLKICVILGKIHMKIWKLKGKN